MTPLDYSVAVAAEVRAEMGRQRKTPIDLADALGMTPATARRRLSGEAPFNVVELMTVAAWLEVPVSQFSRPATADVA